MPRPFIPLPYVEAELIADVKRSYPLVFGAKNLVEGEKCEVSYTELNWQLSAVVMLRWQLDGDGILQQAVPYSYRANANAPGGYKWVCEDF